MNGFAGKLWTGPMGALITFADREGIIRLWNSGAEAIFGYSAIEAVGQDIEIIIPEKLVERHRQGYLKVMETGDSKYGRELLAVPANAKGRRPDFN